MREATVATQEMIITNKIKLNLIINNQPSYINHLQIIINKIMAIKANRVPNRFNNSNRLIKLNKCKFYRNNRVNYQLVQNKGLSVQIEFLTKLQKSANIKDLKKSSKFWIVIEMN